MAKKELWAVSMTSGARLYVDFNPLENGRTEGVVTGYLYSNYEYNGQCHRVSRIHLNVANIQYAYSETVEVA